MVYPRKYSMVIKEIRVHGRGGQGAVTTSQVIAISAFHDGKYSQAFPSFGVERRGAPVQSFSRISDKKINVRQQVYNPDYVIVLDPSLLDVTDVSSGIKKNGLIIVNTDKDNVDIETSAEIKILDVTKVALDVIGKPFVNIASLGGFSALTDEISLESLKTAVDENFKGKEKIAEINKKAAQKVYDMVK